jgi:hypothetical protein
MGRACLVLSILTITLAACAEHPRTAGAPALLDCIPKPTLKDLYACTQNEQAPAPEPTPAADKAR